MRHTLGRARSPLLPSEPRGADPGGAAGIARHGDYAYDYAYDYAGHLARVQVAGRDGDRLSGRVSYTSEFATFAGPVTCVTVDGADAWLSGPITSGSSGFEGLDGWAARIHDAGSPGWIGDSAITFVDTVVGVHELCAAGTSDYDSYLVRIVEGNVVVHPAR